MNRVRRRSLAVLCALSLGSIARAQPAKPTSRPTTLPLAAKVGSGISGPGVPFSPDWPVLAKRRRANAPSVANGLIPNVRPLLDLHVRDTILRPGGDGNYYLTGSTGDDIWVWNQGVEFWRRPRRRLGHGATARGSGRQWTCMAKASSRSGRRRSST